MTSAAETITVTLPDGARREIPAGTPAGRLLEEALGPKRAKRLVLARVDGELRDLAAPLHDGAAVEGVFAGDEAALETLRHTAAHVLAQAVQELFPGTKLGIGPAIENGFYYDFDRETPFTPEDLERIEERMAEIIRAGEPVTRRDLSMDEARRFFAGRGEAYKLELLDDLAREGHESVSVYEQGGFADLCRGPHLPHTGHVAAVRLLHTAGAYWRGDEKRPMLQRIYGTAFFDAKALKRHLKHLEEARKRDHRRLGKELDLFSIQDEVGPGLILWHPRGAALRRAIEDFWREEHRRRGYGMLFTPHIARRDLWKTSGHLDFYAESMYAPMEIDEVRYQIKPMNCPFHIAVYNSRRRSYRELPLRWCELGTVYRYERTGTLHGLMRVRGFTQDDAHVFCRPDQLEGEIDAILDMTLYMLRVFGFDRYDIYLSTRPEKYVGTEDNWERATGALRSALERRGLAFEVDPGEGVFYGPKIDIKIRDCLDRSWQCSTIQVDFNLPERFEVRYAGEDSRPHAPIMIHRALLGSLERFIGVLIEHYAGAFPLWLAPVQCRVLTVTDRHDAWAAEVAERLTAAGFRAETDLRNEKLGRKIRDAQVEKVPYMLVVGDRETADRTVSPRRHKGETLEALSLDEFVSLLETECRRPFTEAAAA